MVAENELLNEENVSYWRKELYTSLYRYMTVTMFKWFMRSQTNPKKFAEDFLLEWRRIAVTKHANDFQKEKIIGDIMGTAPTTDQRKEFMKAFSQVVSIMDEVFETILGDTNENDPG